MEKIKGIEDIERFAQQFKFDESIKEIKVKPRENTAMSQKDFETNFKKASFLSFFLSNFNIVSIKIVRENIFRQ